jgi:hypothetical protein
MMGVVGVIVCGGAQISCSLLLDWTGFSETKVADAGPDTTVVPPDADRDDGGLDGGAVPDAASLTACGVDGLCSPPVPAAAGWSGPYSLLSGSGAPGSLPTCASQGYQAQSAFEGNAGLDGGGAQCGCSCSAPQNIGCDPPMVTFFSDNACSMPCGPPVRLNGCVTTGICTADLEVGSPTASAGSSCTPDASVALPALAWAQSARACKPPTDAAMGSCTQAGALCLPASEPFCIMQQGDLPCPAGDYSFRRVYYSGTSDQRGCGPCTCGAPTGTTCAYPPGVPPLFSYSATGCTVPTGNPYFAPTTPACTGKLGTVGALQLQLEATITDAGTCAPSSPPATGAATPAMPSTFCCTR